MHTTLFRVSWLCALVTCARIAQHAYVCPHICIRYSKCPTTMGSNRWKAVEQHKATYTHGATVQPHRHIIHIFDELGRCLSLSVPLLSQPCQPATSRQAQIETFEQRPTYSINNAHPSSTSHQRTRKKEREPSGAETQTTNEAKTRKIHNLCVFFFMTVGLYRRARVCGSGVLHMYGSECVRTIIYTI